VHATAPAPALCAGSALTHYTLHITHCTLRACCLLQSLDRLASFRSSSSRGAKPIPTHIRSSCPATIQSTIHNPRQYSNISISSLAITATTTTALRVLLCIAEARRRQARRSPAHQLCLSYARQIYFCSSVCVAFFFCSFVIPDDTVRPSTQQHAHHRCFIAYQPELASTQNNSRVCASCARVRKAHHNLVRVHCG